MNTGSLLHALNQLFSNNKEHRTFFVVAADTMKSTLQKAQKENNGSLTYPILCIQNTDPITMRGKHWLAWFITSPTTSEVFDSYGNFVRKYTHVEWPTRYITAENCTAIQSGRSTLCGGYCLYYLYSRQNGIPYKQFLNQFSSYVLQNDRKIKRFLSMIPNLKETSPYECPHQLLQSNTFKINCVEFLH